MLFNFVLTRTKSHRARSTDLSSLDITIHQFDKTNMEIPLLCAQFLPLSINDQSIGNALFSNIIILQVPFQS